MSLLRFAMKRPALQNLLDRAMSVVPSTEVAPVLKNFRVSAEDDGTVMVAASNMEQTLRVRATGVQVEQAGVAILPARRFSDVVRAADGEQFTVNVQEDNSAWLTDDHASWVLKLIHAWNEYPTLPTIDGQFQVPIARVRLLHAIQAVRYAAATQTYRQNLRMLDVSNNRMRAADGVRFQQVELGQNFPMNFHLPIGSVEGLVHTLTASEDEDVCVAQDDNHLYFGLINQTFITYKANAIYPDVDEMQLKPALANDQELWVDRGALVRAIKQVRITANPDTSAVVLSLSGTALQISSKDKTGSWSSASVDVKYDGPDKEIGVNHSHLLDMLRMISGPECHFFLGEGKKSRQAPLLLKDTEGGSIGVLNQLAGKHFE